MSSVTLLDPMRDCHALVAFATPLALRFSFHTSFPHCFRKVRPSNPQRPAYIQPQSLQQSPRSTSPTTAKPDAVAAATTQFVSWLKSNGMILADRSGWGRAPHALAIANETYDDGEPAGRGLVAIRPVVQGEPIFEVPARLVLTKEVAVREFGPVGKNVEDVDEYVALALLLIRERAKGEESFWKPYLDVLPEDHEFIPLFRWSEEDLGLLRGSPTLVACSSLQEKLRREYAGVVEDVFEKNRRSFPEDVFTWEAWEWAFAVLFSRAVLLRKESILALVPYADLLNHNPYCSCYIEMEKRIITREKYVCYFVDRPYTKMSQVFVTYGQKSNTELLLLYGFLVDRNPYDNVEISVSLDENDPLYERKREYRESSGVGPVTKFPLYIDRYPKELIEYLRFCVATEEEFTSDFGQFISEENESLVAAAIIKCCEDALQGYPQTLAEDSALMDDKRLYNTLGLKARYAIRQRRNEKRILTRTIANIEKEFEKPEYLFNTAAE